MGFDGNAMGQFLSGILGSGLEHHHKLEKQDREREDSEREGMLKAVTAAAQSGNLDPAAQMSLLRLYVQGTGAKGRKGLDGFRSMLDNILGQGFETTGLHTTGFDPGGAPILVDEGSVEAVRRQNPALMPPQAGADSPAPTAGPSEALLQYKAGRERLKSQLMLTGADASALQRAHGEAMRALAGRRGPQRRFAAEAKRIVEQVSEIERLRGNMERNVASGLANDTPTAGAVVEKLGAQLKQLRREFDLLADKYGVKLMPQAPTVGDTTAPEAPALEAGLTAASSVPGGTEVSDGAPIASTGTYRKSLFLSKDEMTKRRIAEKVQEQTALDDAKWPGRKREIETEAGVKRELKLLDLKARGEAAQKRFREKISLLDQKDKLAETIKIRQYAQAYLASGRAETMEEAAVLAAETRVQELELGNYVRQTRGELNEVTADLAPQKFDEAQRHNRRTEEIASGNYELRVSAGLRGAAKTTFDIATRGLFQEQRKIVSEIERYNTRSAKGEMPPAVRDERVKPLQERLDVIDGQIEGERQKALKQLGGASHGAAESSTGAEDADVRAYADAHFGGDYAAAVRAIQAQRRRKK